MAVQSKHEGGGSPVDDEVPDLWIVAGDSVRLPDGELVPHTLGALRARYGFAIVDENINADDFDGPHARSCRLPYFRFALSVNDTARKVPDSARVTSVDVDTSGVEGINRYFASRTGRRTNGEVDVALRDEPSRVSLHRSRRCYRCNRLPLSARLTFVDLD